MSKLVFCESSPWWATKFRQMCDDANFPIVESRIYSDLNQFTDKEATGLVAVSVELERIDEVVLWAKRIHQSRSHSRCVALASRELKSSESTLLMSGFIDVYTEVAELPRLARLTQRHLSLLPEEKSPWRESVNRRLPWSRYSSPETKLPSQNRAISHE